MLTLIFIAAERDNPGVVGHAVTANDGTEITGISAASPFKKNVADKTATGRPGVVVAEIIILTEDGISG